jgi:hypothetical protein
LFPIIVELNPFSILSFVLIELLFKVPTVEFCTGDGFVDYCKSGVRDALLHDPKLVGIQVGKTTSGEAV